MFRMPADSMRRFAVATAFCLSFVATPPARGQQVPQALPAGELERVLDAIENLPPATQKEVMAAFRYMQEEGTIRHYQDPACMTLKFLEWRLANPDGPGSIVLVRRRLVEVNTWREWLLACAQRDRIVKNQVVRAQSMLSDEPEDQRTRRATCVGETFADFYLKNPVATHSTTGALSPLSNLFVQAMSECRRAEAAGTLAAAAEPARAQVAEAQVRRISLPPEDRSWENDPAVQKLKNHFLVGRDLWSAATNQLVAKDFAGYAPRFVAGRPDLLLYGGQSAFGLVRATPNLASPGVKPRFAWMEICAAPGRCQRAGITMRYPGPFLYRDLRRVVYFKEGDLWRAEVDWTTGEIVNHRQVTRVGILHERRHGDIAPIHWHEHILFIRTAFSRERPILRVDLRTGQIDELETMRVFERNMFPNPSGSRLCAPHGEFLACYDVRSGDTSRVSLFAALDGFVYRGAPPDATSETPSDALWVDDDTLLIRAQTRIVRVDFRGGTVDPLFTVEVDRGERAAVGPLTLLPSGRHVAVPVTLEGPTTRTASARPSRVIRVSIEDGSAVPLPEHLAHDGVWLDADQVVYTRQTGEIGEIGTWLEDMGSNETKRICHVPAPLHRETQGGVLYFPDRNALYFHNALQTREVMRADIASGGCQRLVMMPGEGGLMAFRTPPLDLRLGVSGEALWDSP